MEGGRDLARQACCVGGGSRPHPPGSTAVDNRRPCIDISRISDADWHWAWAWRWPCPLQRGLLVFLPFIADASFTLARRVVSGERFWEPHRTHLYQRLVLAGWSHRRVVLWEYLLMALTVGSALLAAPHGAGVAWAVLGAWTAALLLLAWGLGRWLGAPRA